MVEPFEFPKFPTQLTEEEAERIEGLKSQKEEFEKVYQQRLTPAAFRALPKWQTAPISALHEVTAKFPLTGIREILPNFLITPELAQERKLELDREIFELEREALVTSRLPLIQAELTYYRLIGESVTDPGFLDSLFKDLAQDFTQDERRWITAFAQ